MTSQGVNCFLHALNLLSSANVIPKVLSDPWWQGPGLSQKSGEHGRPAGRVHPANCHRKFSDPLWVLHMVTVKGFHQFGSRGRSHLTYRLNPPELGNQQSPRGRSWSTTPSEERHAWQWVLQILLLSTAVQYWEGQRYAHQLTKRWTGTTLPWRHPQEKLPLPRQPIRGHLSWTVTEEKVRPGNRHIRTVLKAPERTSAAKCRGRWNLPSTQCAVYSAWRSAFIWGVMVPCMPPNITVVPERAVRDRKNFSSSRI